MFKGPNRIRNIIIAGVLLLACLPLADVGYGLYAYTGARQTCTNHMMYNIPGRGRLTDNPYSTEEINMIRLDCRAHGLESQLENVRLQLNKTRVSKRLDAMRSQCEAVTNYQFSWGCG